MTIDLEKFNRAIELVSEVADLVKNLAEDNRYSIQLHLAKVHASSLEYALKTINVEDLN